MPVSAQAHVEIAEVKAGLRGALATKNFSTNDVVISVPRNLVIELGPSSAPSHVRLLLVSLFTCYMRPVPGQGLCCSCDVLLNTAHLGSGSALSAHASYWP